MKKALVAGLGGTLVAALGLTLGQPAVATNPSTAATLAAPGSVSHEAARVTSDDLPNPGGQAPRAPRGGRQGRAQRRGDGRAARRRAPSSSSADEQAPGVAGEQGRTVRRAGPGDDRPDLRDPGRVRQRAAPGLPGPGHRPGHPGPGAVRRPADNEIPEPDRAVDNSTVWQADYNRPALPRTCTSARARVESLKNYYETQSSGRYSVDGTVTDWVKVQYNEARYGRSNGFPCGEQRLQQHLGPGPRRRQPVGTPTSWPRAAPPAEINAELATFDQWDRYDYDGDGNFNEPDGYIDHFQIVHAGGDQADGDPCQGEDAIWSHRWYAFQRHRRSRPGRQPAAAAPRSATPASGSATTRSSRRTAAGASSPTSTATTWACRTTTTSSRRRQQQRALDADGAEPARRQGRAVHRRPRRRPRRLEQAPARLARLRDRSWPAPASAATGRSTLGPQEYNTDKPQAVVVVLPKKEVATDLGAPSAGTKQWFSGDARRPGQHDDPAGRPCPASRGHADVQGPLGHRGLRPGRRVTTPTSRSTDGSRLRRPFAGHDHHAGRGQRHRRHAGDVRPGDVRPVRVRGPDDRLRFRYSTDPAAPGNDAAVPDGIFVDDDRGHRRRHHRVHRRRRDRRQRLDPGGFTVVGAQHQPAVRQLLHRRAPHLRVVRPVPEDRPVLLRLPNTKPDLVDHYAYQQGLLISYWDTSHADNDTFAHPGSGRNLYVDAHPPPFYRLDGLPWRARIQVYDAPFSLKQGRLVHAAPQRPAPATSVARPRSRCSTTPRSTSTRSCRTTASSCPRSESRSACCR